MTKRKEMNVSEEKKPPSGNMVDFFTNAQKKRPSFSRRQLDDILNDPDHVPEDILALLDSDYHDLFESDAGVWEQYTIRSHTLSVMRQFRKYFYGKKLPGNVSDKFFEFLLSLHDLGKPRAVAEGDKHRQHEYNREIVDIILSCLGYDRQHICLTQAIVSTDPIGRFLKDRSTVAEAAKEIADAAKGTGYTAKDFWELLKIFYQCDAGSYTEDAGNLYSLDHLFLFEPEKGSMSFSEKSMGKIKKLDEAIAII